MDLATTVSLASAFAALLSALYAASAARSARRSADLAQKEADEHSKGLSAYLVDAFQWAQSEHREIVAVGFTLTNLASLPNTVMRTELVLHEYADSGEPSRLILTPVETVGPPGQALQQVELPLNLAPRTTASGWLTFLVPANFAKGKTIDKYELVFLDSTGRRTKIETYLMRKIVYVETDG